MMRERENQENLCYQLDDDDDDDDDDIRFVSD